MKYLLLLLVLFSCKKEDETRPAPTPATDNRSILGEYHGQTTCEPSGTYNQTIYVIDGNKAVFHNSQLTGDTVQLNVMGANVTIPSQAFVNNGFIGGFYYVAGTGTYSYPQLILNISITFSESTSIYNCTYVVTK